MENDVRALEFKRGAKFVGLVIKTSLLTLITLGIYRFWKNAKLRRYYWSAIHVNGDPLEYRGTGFEAFLGFLAVVVILALYLTLVISALYFAGVVTFANLQIIQVISMIALIPFLYLAQYRFRRYIASRTRWRGIRFGVENASFGYMWRGIGYFLLFIVTLGFSGPYGRFKLDKFMSDRTWFGHFQLKQHGNWKELWQYYYPLWGSALFLVCAFVLFWQDIRALTKAEELGNDILNTDTGVTSFSMILIGYVLLIMFSAHYSIRSQAYLLSQKLLGDRVGFTSNFTTRGTVWRYIGGLLLASIVGSLVMTAFVIVIAILALIFSIIFPGIDIFGSFSTIFAEGGDEEKQVLIIMLAFVPIYLLMLIAMKSASEIFVKAVLIEYFTNNTALTNASALDEVKQRAQDDMDDADGWGEALDVGFGL